MSDENKASLSAMAKPRTEAEIWAAYDEAIKPAGAAYDEALERADAAYGEASKRARAARDAALAELREA